MKKLKEHFNRQKHSLRVRMVVLVTFTTAVLVVFLMVNNIYAINVVRNNAYETNAAMLEMCVNNIDDAFDAIDNYWIGLQGAADVPVLAYGASRLDFYTAKARLMSDMANTIQSYNYIDDLFMYVSEPIVCHNGEIAESQYFDAAKYDMPVKERNGVREMIMSYLDNSDGSVPGQWQGMEYNGNYYLVRILRYRSIYMGGCVNVNSLIKAIESAGFTEAAYATWFQNNGRELGRVLSGFDAKFNIPETAATFSCEIENEDFLIISQPSECGDYSLVAAIREQTIIEGLGILQKIIIILGVGLIIFLGMFTAAIRQWILKPVRKLYEAMNRLKDGDFTIRVANRPSSCREFELVNETFDRMIENIEDLKINVYEEKMSHQKTQLRYQKAELQYMKLQVNPHFYINCLNIIHNLSIMNKNDLVRDMTTYLGNHLRYTMEGTTVDALYKEIDYVNNYLRIQELRFPGSLKAYIEIAPDVRDVKVPPLIIQTFVENTVKYQVVAGERTELYIIACRSEPEDSGKIMIEIWDSGDGFPEYVLEKLGKGEKIMDDRGEHFGIRNVVIRCRLIYKGRETISFDNHWETGGAHITIELPEDPGELQEV